MTRNIELLQTARRHAKARAHVCKDPERLHKLAVRIGRIRNALRELGASAEVA